MKISINFNNNPFSADLNQPIDISIPLKEGMETVNCFWATYMDVAPVRMGSFVGSTQEGGAVNFKTVKFTPHGNGTHTECVGHISKEVYTINQSLKQFHFVSQLISIYPQKQENGDRVITKEQLEGELIEGIQAIVIRTQPNDDLKLQTNYSGTNPPFIHHEAIEYLVKHGIEHLLLDLPSVDREEDDGKLLAHKAFWKYPENIRTNATITELIYVDNRVKDGLYLLNIQIASFELDASPSKPVLYKLK
ncbi:MAG: cyclase family protein [Saprospiraceae bacterium]